MGVEIDNKNIDILFNYLKSILYDNPVVVPELNTIEAPYYKLGQGLEVLQELTEEMLTYSSDISQGSLSVPYPSKENPLCSNLKKIHASLRQLTWQLMQVIEGDYSQQITCLGEFSNTFNTIITQLKEKENQLNIQKAEIERQADLLNSYNDLLLELTRKQKEWILVVDAKNRDIVYCNKRGRGKTEVEDDEFCKICESRLPFRDKILNWEDYGQEHSWGYSDENHQYYKITTFPLQWQKRYSYAHILVDVTDERLKTRTLKDKAYHDALTGIYNRIYFEEYMDKIIRERTSIVFCYLDLDCLKTVNDEYGHSEGDIYICRFISTVQQYFRTTDIFCRVGGDEFCLILEDISKRRASEKLYAAMRQFQSYRDKGYQHGFSYGIVEVNGITNPKTLREIIGEADAAMYECKRKNKEQYKKYHLEVQP